MSSPSDAKHPAGRPLRGDFGWQPLCSAFEPTLEDMLSDRSYFGMPPEALYLWGTFRDEDGEIYCPMRRIPSGLPTDAKDTRRRFYLCSTLGHDGRHAHARGRSRSVPNDNFSRTLEDERIHWRSDPAQHGNRFHVTWTPDDCSWLEEGAMDVRGKLVKPGMHWYLPGRDAGMYYVANIFEMEGTILGQQGARHDRLRSDLHVRRRRDLQDQGRARAGDSSSSSGTPGRRATRTAASTSVTSRSVTTCSALRSSATKTAKFATPTT